MDAMASGAQLRPARDGRRRIDRPVDQHHPVDRRRGGRRDVALGEVGGDHRGIALQRIAEAAAARALHQQEVVAFDGEGAHLARQRRGLNRAVAAADPEAIGGAGGAAADAERR
jgi:hypothetical protein